MKQLRILPLIFLWLSVYSFLQAQDLPCGTTRMMEKAGEENPGMEEVQRQLEAFTSQWLPIRQKQNGIASDTILYVIPVVVHIIHNYGPENFPDEQVYDAIRILNEDFQKRNKDTTQVKSDFQPIIGDIQVEFRLARIDPNGNCTNGITRTVSPITYNAESDSKLKSLISWNTSKYMNIWVVNIIPDAGGYAYYPGTAPQAYREGIVIRNTQFGSILTSGGSNFASRSLTHEAGHYFNLRHVWGGGNSPGDAANCNNDDLVGDTPNTVGSSQSCDLSQQSCNSLDNVNNYMDYSTCGRMFTQGQQSRMDAALNNSAGSRNNLWTAANRLATGTNDGYSAAPCTPVPDFKPGVVFLCKGDSIQFSNLSWNAPADSISAEWTCTGGYPVVSYGNKTYVRYDSAGKYDVQLKVSTSGGADSLVKNGIVHVSGDSADLKGPFLQDFETIAFPDQDWLTLGEGSGSNDWKETTLASVSGNTSIRVDNYTLGAESEVSAFVTPTFDISQLQQPTMTFKLAYAQKTSADADKLQVYASLNCGKTWLQRYNRSGALLQTTTGTKGSQFIPAASEWREETISLAFAGGAQQIRFKFEFTSNLGNNIYIDDINVDGTNSLEDEIEKELAIHLMPNPSRGPAYFGFTLPSADKVRLYVTDITGRIVQDVVPEELLSQGRYSYVLDLEGKAGIYMVHLHVGTYRSVRKWVRTR